jgi:hypothetical protein
LEEGGQLGELVASVHEAVEKELDFFDNVLAIGA